MYLLISAKMKLKKILTTILLTVLIVTPVYGYESLECSSDPVFSKNSCNQCFKGNKQSEGETLGFLFDDWINDTSNNMLLYKEIQEEPRFVNLYPEKAEWSQVPSSQNFWEYTSEFENIYSDSEEGYVLEPGKKVTWIKSKLGYGYNLVKNKVPLDQNLALLIFPITAHVILDDGSVSDENGEHNECVLYTSGEDIAPDPRERLPDAGPTEFGLLALLAMIFSFVLVRMKRKSL
ncbi:MAG: hypothetical protein GY828_04020 [Candidatus Gracilibacteria bacterium]|nr:hypothetical protein [Candidatus Gracilibacteria bacterium]